MKDHRTRDEAFMTKYGYLALNHPVEFAAMFFFATLGAISLVSDISGIISAQLSMHGWSKYLFCVVFSLIHFSYWKNKAKQQEAGSTNRQ